VALEELGGVHPAHARELAVLPAGGDHLLVGVGDFGVVELAGDAELEVWRGGKKQTLGVAVGEMRTEKTARAGDQPGVQEGGKLGLAVRPLTPEERKQLGRGAQGLVVEGASGPAAKAGIRRGDLVTAVNGQPVKTVEELRALVEKSKDAVALLIRRGDATVFVPIEVG